MEIEVKNLQLEGMNVKEANISLVIDEIFGII